MAAKREVPDLNKILKRLQGKYLPGCKQLPVICWAYPKRETKESCLFGSFLPAQNFIYINFVLSRPFVPAYFLDHVVVHELFHRAQDEHPIADEAPHSERFMEWDRSYIHYEKARAWEAKNLERIIREINRLVK